MAVYLSEFVTDLAMPPAMRPIPHQFVMGDNNAYTFTALLCDSRNPDAGLMAGTVSGELMRPDGETVALTGTKGIAVRQVNLDAGGMCNATPCSVTLPQACFAYPGRVTLVIKLTDGTTVTQALAVSAVVVRTSTDVVVDPGEIVPDVAALQAAAAEALSAASGSVRYDAAQSLTEAQKAQARLNIGDYSMGGATPMASRVSFTSEVAAPCEIEVQFYTAVQEGTGDPSPTNIRPITGGITSVDVTVSPTTTAADGVTKTVSWTIPNVGRIIRIHKDGTAEIAATHYLLSDGDTRSWTIVSTTGGKVLARTDLGAIFRCDWTDILCNAMTPVDPTTPVADRPENSVTIRPTASSGQLEITVPSTYNTNAKIKAYLGNIDGSGTKMTMLYKRPASQGYDWVDGGSDKGLSSYIGQNYAWASAGNICVSYGVGIFEYVDNAIAAAQNSREISILFVGNSLTQDGIAYLPYLLTHFYPGIKFRFYIWYNGGYTLGQQYSKFTADTACEIFSVAENASAWTNSNNTVKMSAVLSTYRFDIVCMQEYFNYKTGYTDTTDWDNCAAYIQSHYTGGNGLEFISLFHAPKRDNAESIFQLTETGNGLILQTTQADDMIPIGMAVYRALSTDLDSLGDQGHLSPDGTHTQEGLPCLLQTYTALLWLLDRLGLSRNIYGLPFKMTAAIYAGINVPGPNLGTGVIEGTDAQNLLAQKVAILAYKEGKAFVANHIFGS